MSRWLNNKPVELTPFNYTQYEPGHGDRLSIDSIIFGKVVIAGGSHSYQAEGYCEFPR